jgi:hypothetical protein
VGVLLDPSDIMAIQKLKHRFGQYLDHHNLDGICSVFTDDADLELGPWGRRVGMAQIREGYTPGTTLPRSAGVMHNLSDSIIEAEGEGAKSTWILTQYRFEPPTDAPPGTPFSPVELVARYHERYRRVEQHWKISAMRIDVLWIDSQGAIGPKNPARKITK